MLIEYIKVFAVGGALCAIGQILIDKTKLTPARILPVYVVAGLILEAVGLYSPLVKWAGAGATVPLTGFGSTLAKGVEKAVSELGVLGAFTGLSLAVIAIPKPVFSGFTVFWAVFALKARKLPDLSGRQIRQLIWQRMKDSNPRSAFGTSCADLNYFVRVLVPSGK